MWMEVHMYSVKAKSQAGNIRVKDIVTIARAHASTRLTSFMRVKNSMSHFCL